MADATRARARTLHDGTGYQGAICGGYRKTGNWGMTGYRLPGRIHTSAADMGTVPPELMGSFQIIFYQSAEDAVFKALGVE